MTNWLCHAWLENKKLWHANKAASGVCYRLLYTNVADEIFLYFITKPSYSRGKWCLSVMDKVYFEVKKCVGNAFPNDLKIQVYRLSKQ